MSTSDFTAGIVEWPDAEAEPGPGRASVSGSLDDVEFDFRQGWIARGWAVDYGAPDQPVEVEIVEGETVLGRGLASQFREDLQQAGIGSGAVAFAIELQPHIGERSRPELAARLADSDIVIAPPKTVEIKRFSGHVDGIEGRVVLGWAFDAARLGTPVSVEIIVDDEFVAHVTADQFRRDLAELGFGNAYFGFEWVLPSRFVDGQPHVVRARIANSATDLDGEVPEVLLLPGSVSAEARRLAEEYEDARR